MSYLRKDKRLYWVLDSRCIGRECLALGFYQHRSPMAGGGSRNTGSPDTPCCLTNAYRGCPLNKIYSRDLEKERRKQGIKPAK
jgi:hypothetical protein